MPSRSAAVRLRRWLPFAACIGCAMSEARAQPTPPGSARVAGPLPRALAIHLNGRLFLAGVAVRSERGEEVLVAVGPLQRAIDGPALTDGRQPPAPRLRVEGTKLFASASGGCDECPARVTRPVIISGRVRMIEGVPWFPLADLVTAFEGRLQVDAAKSVYGIYAGKCMWCILEPR